MKKLILFDIDGTLLLTGGAGKRSVNQVFSKLYGIEEAWQNIVPDGRTDPYLFREVFQQCLGRLPNSQEVNRIAEVYTQEMEAALPLAENFRLMPGVEELLRVLQEREMALLGLATGNFEVTAYLKLKRAGLRDYFSFGGFDSDFHDRLKLTGRAVENGRQKLGRRTEPEEIFLIGDSIHDIRCGKWLGLTTVAVCTGSTPKEVLQSHRPDFIWDTLTPLDEVLLMFE